MPGWQIAAGGWAINNGLVNGCWSYARRALFAVVLVAIAIGLLVYHQLDEQIRCHVEDTLAAQYPHLHVSVGAATLHPGKGVEVRDVEITSPEANEPIVSIRELFIAADTNLDQLIQGRLKIRMITVRGPTVRAVRHADGTWNLAQLLPLPSLSDEPPPAMIEGGRVEFIDPAGQRAPQILRDVTLKIDGTRERLATGRTRRTARLRGSFVADNLRSATLDATLDADAGVWSAAGSFDDLVLSHELCCWSPGNRPEMSWLDHARATMSGAYRVRFDPTATPALLYESSGQVTRGRLEDPRLPYALANVQGRFAVTHEGCRVEDITAECGPSKFTGRFERNGHTPTSPMRILAQGQRLVLDRKFYDTLPEAWQSDWQKFMPTGELDLDAELVFDGQRWRSHLTARCQNMAFAYHKFPYRISHGHGTIDYRDGVVTTDLAATAESAELQITGQTQLTHPYTTGWVEVRGRQMRFDEKLFAAFPQRGGEAIRSLRPTGNFDVFFRQWRDTPDVEQAHSRAVVNVAGCGLSYDRFAYPLSDVTGTLEMNDQHWTFNDLQGTNDSARVACSGQIVPHEDGCEVLVSIGGHNVALDDELSAALPPGAQRLWHDLKPRGNIDLDAQVHHLPGRPDSHVWIRMRPLEKNVSIEPAAFPYRMENLAGVFIYSDGRVWLEQVRGAHGETDIALAGQGELLEDGGWQLQLEQLAVDRLAADRDLIHALPERLKRVVTDLQIEEPVGMRGSLVLKGGATPETPLTSEWNLEFDFHQNSLVCCVPLENVNGGLTLVGAYDGKAFQSRGELAIDSLTYKDLQFTDILGPVSLEDSRVLLGFWADRVQNITPERRLTFQAYGGAGTADGWVQLTPESKYQFHAQLTGGDLGRLTHEAIPGRQSVTGRVMAEVEIGGRGSSVHQLEGRGVVRLVDADIYQFPMMLSMLKVLSVRPPDATAFDKGDIDFRIAGEHVYLDRIDFNGDAISLLGKGEVDFHKNIRLTFHPVVGRDEARLPLMSKLMGSAGEQVLLLHCEGTLDDPVMRREAFPGVSQALQQLQSEFQPIESRR